MESIIQDKKECWLCHTTYNLHSHHIFYGRANRKKSEKYGLKIWLCGRHHNMSNEGIHFNRELDISAKKMAQERFELKYNRDIFRKEFGKSYL